MNSSDIPVFPVARWDAGPVPALGFFMWRPHYLASPMQAIDQATPSRYYALTPVQLRELAQTMLAAADALERSPPTAAGSPQH